MHDFNTRTHMKPYIEPLTLILRMKQSTSLLTGSEDTEEIDLKPTPGEGKEGAFPQAKTSGGWEFDWEEPLHRE